MSEWFGVIKDIATHAVSWMNSIEFADVSLWHWLLGIWGVSLILIAVRMFSGLSGPGLSYGIQQTVEASRMQKRKEEK